MKKITLLTALLSSYFLGSLLFEDGPSAKPSSYGSPPGKISKTYKKRGPPSPLRGKSYYSYGKGKPKGYYSYRYADGINTRKFTDPTLNGQNAFGPLESDYFFSTPRPPIGGDSPYMH